MIGYDPSWWWFAILEWCMGGFARSIPVVDEYLISGDVYVP